MPKPTSVKYFSNTMLGAPTISATAGTLLGVLQACLVDGFNTQSVTSASVASNVVTLTFASPHGFLFNQVIEVAGATPAGINGQVRVTAVTVTTVSYEVTSVANGAATGTITAKVAPLGWVREFSGVNKAVYKIDNTAFPTSMPYRVRVDDSSSSTSNWSASIIGYETMVDVDTGGAARIPTTTQQSTGLWIPRTNSSTSNRSWNIIGDGRRFYLQVNSVNTNEGAFAGPWNFIGEISSLKTSDPGGFALYIQSNAVGSTGSDWSGTGVTSVNGTYFYLARGFTGIGSSVGATLAALRMSGLSGYSSNLTFPNGADNGLIMVRPYVMTDSNAQVRGWLPGLYHLPQSLTNRIAYDRTSPYFDDNVASFTNKRVGFFFSNADASGNSGVAAFDMTGDWV